MWLFCVNYVVTQFGFCCCNHPFVTSRLILPVRELCQTRGIFVHYCCFGLCHNCCHIFMPCHAIFWTIAYNFSFVDVLLLVAKGLFYPSRCFFNFDTMTFFCSDFRDCFRDVRQYIAIGIKKLSRRRWYAIFTTFSFAYLWDVMFVSIRLAIQRNKQRLSAQSASECLLI